MVLDSTARAALVALAACSSALAQEVAPVASAAGDVDDLRRAVRRLEAEVATLRAEEPEAPGPSLLEQARVSAAFGKGVTIASPDDAFSLTLRGRLQARFTQLEDGESHTRFEVRRARLQLQGHALSRTVEYYVQLGFANGDTESDLRLALRDAHVTWKVHRELNVRAGQMKVPFSAQRVVSSSAMQMVDRSIVQAELNLDRDVGVTLFSKDALGLGERLGWAVGVFGGDGRNRLATDGGVLAVARLELRPFGQFDDQDEPDLKRSESPGLLLGVAAGWNSRTSRTRSTHDATFQAGGATDYLHGTCDVLLKWRGLSLRAEATLRNAADDEVTSFQAGRLVREQTRSGWGFFVQAGYMLTDRLEVVARHGELRPHGASAVRLARESGAGLGWYVHGHALKVQADYFRLWGESLGEGDDQVRVQLQLYF